MSEPTIRGKVVVITGATSGIGRIAAERLEGAGHAPYQHRQDARRDRFPPRPTGRADRAVGRVSVAPAVAEAGIDLSAVDVTLAGRA